MADLYVPRVAQLDAKFLDDEISSIISEKLAGAFSMTGQKIHVKLEPEINALINLTLYYSTLKERRETSGQAMLNIKYSDHTKPKQLHCYIFSIVFLQWIKKRHSYFLLFVKNPNFKDIIFHYLRYIETGYQTSEVINLIGFLLSGYYPSLLERLFKLKMVPSNLYDKRTLSYNYFTRELLWSSFTDLLAFVLPLITIHKFHKYIKMLLPKNLSESPTHDIELKKIIPKIFILNCIFCNKYPVLPHTLGCQHTACYYCVTSTQAVTPLFKCSICNIDVHNVLPLLVQK